MNQKRQPPYILSIDAGTEAIKAGLFDLQGNRVASGSRNYPTFFPASGWAEQDPADWWSGLVGAVQDCLHHARVAPEEIAGLSADATTCTLMPLDAAGQELGRALLWMDVRAATQAQQIFARGDPALRYCLAGVNAEWMPPKLLWLKENEPALCRHRLPARVHRLDRLAADRPADVESEHGDAALVLSHAERRLAAGFFCRYRAGRPCRQVSCQHPAAGRGRRGVERGRGRCAGVASWHAGGGWRRRCLCRAAGPRCDAAGRPRRSDGSIQCAVRACR